MNLLQISSSTTPFWLVFRWKIPLQGGVCKPPELGGAGRALLVRVVSESMEPNVCCLSGSGTEPEEVWNRGVGGSSHTYIIPTSDVHLRSSSPRTWDLPPPVPPTPGHLGCFSSVGPPQPALPTFDPPAGSAASTRWEPSPQPFSDSFTTGCRDVPRPWRS